MYVQPHGTDEILANEQLGHAADSLRFQGSQEVMSPAEQTEAWTGSLIALADSLDEIRDGVAPEDRTNVGATGYETVNQKAPGEESFFLRIADAAFRFMQGGQR